MRLLSLRQKHSSSYKSKEASDTIWWPSYNLSQLLSPPSTQLLNGMTYISGSVRVNKCTSNVLSTVLITVEAFNSLWPWCKALSRVRITFGCQISLFHCFFQGYVLFFCLEHAPLFFLICLTLCVGFCILGNNSLSWSWSSGLLQEVTLIVQWHDIWLPHRTFWELGSLFHFSLLPGIEGVPRPVTGSQGRGKGFSNESAPETPSWLEAKTTQGA